MLTEGQKKRRRQYHQKWLASLTPEQLEQRKLRIRERARRRYREHRAVMTEKRQFRARARRARKRQEKMAKAAE